MRGVDDQPFLYTPIHLTKINELPLVLRLYFNISLTIAGVEALIAEKIVDICCLGTWVADIYVTSLEK